MPPRAAPFVSEDDLVPEQILPPRPREGGAAAQEDGFVADYRARLLAYVNEVRPFFGNSQLLFEKFVFLLAQFEAGFIHELQAIAAVTWAFFDHPPAVLSFNRFLPARVSVHLMPTGDRYGYQYFGDQLIPLKTPQEMVEFRLREARNRELALAVNNE